jgi:hypothetical protein
MSVKRLPRKSPIDPTLNFPWWYKWGIILGAGFWGWYMLFQDRVLSVFPRETYDDK